MVSRKLSALANLVKNQISTLNKRVQSELGVDPRYKTLGAVTLDLFPKAPIGKIAWVGSTLGN